MAKRAYVLFERPISLVIALICLYLGATSFPTAAVMSQERYPCGECKFEEWAGCSPFLPTQTCLRTCNVYDGTCGKYTEYTYAETYTFIVGEDGLGPDDCDRTPEESELACRHEIDCVPVELEDWDCNDWWGFACGPGDVGDDCGYCKGGDVDTTMESTDECFLCPWMASE